MLGSSGLQRSILCELLYLLFAEMVMFFILSHLPTTRRRRILLSLISRLQLPVLFHPVFPPLTPKRIVAVWLDL